MEYVGVGTVTGLYGVSGIENAVLVDSPRAFDNIKKGIERVTGERQGCTGIRSIVGRQSGVGLVLVQVPPYPQAVVDAVSELYIFGIRRVIGLGRAFSLTKRLPSRPVLMAKAAVPLDAVSTIVADEGLPLAPSSKMEYTFKTIVELRFTDFNWIYGYTVTTPSPYIRSLTESVRKLAGKRGVIAIDSMSSALYALQYEYSKLETLSLLSFAGSFEQIASSSVVRSVDDMTAIMEKIGREETILYMIAVEIFKKLG